MEKHTGRSKDAFTPAAGGMPAPANHGAMALIIDIQGVGGMSPEDDRAYLARLGKSIEELRNNHVPITWVTIGNRNQLYPPAGTSSAPRYDPGNFSQMVDMGYGGADPANDKNGIFRDFLLRYGPRQNEAIYVKFFEGSFTEPGDIAGNYDGPPVPENPADFQKAFGNGETLTGFCRRQGITDLLLMGAVSTHCVVGTAFSGILKGFRSWIGLNGILSWSRPEDEKKWTPESRLVHSPESFHRDKINTRLVEMSLEEMAARKLTQADLHTVRNSFTTVPDFIATLESQQSPLASPPANGLTKPSARTR